MLMLLWSLGDAQNVERATCTAPRRRALIAQTLAACTRGDFVNNVTRWRYPNTGIWPAWPGPCIIFVRGLEKLFITDLAGLT